MTSDTPLHQLLRALVRFWWIAIGGIVLAVLVFVLATYKVSGFPPSFESRAQSTYSASTQVLITSKREPYLSATNVNAKIINLQTSDTNATSTDGGTTGTAPTQTYDSGSGADGDLQRLVEIANDLPPRVTSDPVIKLRNQKFRRIQGTVTAVNPYAFSGAGGFRSGPLPYIKITGTANSPQDALDITNTTALAFKTWFEQRQADAKIKTADRVLVEQVNSAETAVPQGGSKPLLGVAAALLVLLGVAGLALALDRLIPHTVKSRRASVTEPRERPEPARPAPEARKAEIAEPVAVEAAEPLEVVVISPEVAPEVSEPEVSKAEVSEPEVSEPEVSKPEVSEPEVSEPEAPAKVELPPLEVPTMTFGAQIEEAANGEAPKAPTNGAKKPTSRNRKGASNGSAAARRRRTTASSPKIVPNTDDAS